MFYYLRVKNNSHLEMLVWLTNRGVSKVPESGSRLSSLSSIYLFNGSKHCQYIILIIKFTSLIFSLNYADIISLLFYNSSVKVF